MALQEAGFHGETHVHFRVWSKKGGFTSKELAFSDNPLEASEEVLASLMAIEASGRYDLTRVEEVTVGTDLEQTE